MDDGEQDSVSNGSGRPYKVDLKSIHRRDFLAAAGFGAIALASGASVIAGPFESGVETGQYDKRLSSSWIESLTARGKPTCYKGSDLRKIGMPVGGIGAGQLYLCGDGTLKHWDIFNVLHSTGAGGYAHPRPPQTPLEQGFAIQVNTGPSTSTHRLDHTGFTDITFCGQYPVGNVSYRDRACPVGVELEAFSPFIPLNADDSGLPATILNYTLTNLGDTPVRASIVGWLQNAVLQFSAPQIGVRTNTFHRQPDITVLECTADIGCADDTDGLPDYGELTLALLGRAPEHAAAECIPGSFALPDFESAFRNLSETLVGSLGRRVHLSPGESSQVRFILAWRFPNLSIDGLGDVGRHYAVRFDSAQAVAQYVSRNFDRLAGQTRLWRDTWYDSTLPYWFLDRTLLNVCNLATSSCYRFANGRFYAWEGVGCCPGTCTHVWQYAHSMARLFPELERDTRERVDFGTAFHSKSGVIGFRAEFNSALAVDGQAGTLLRAYREHLISPNSDFLRRNWPRIKGAFEPLFRLDGNGDGVLEGAQMNTLDQPWFGEISWLSSLYVAALRAGAAMAVEMNDPEFASKCRSIADKGSKNIDSLLFNGEYYIQAPDSSRGKSVGSYDGCEIDQVFGASWARQVGLRGVLPTDHVRAALLSLWKHNFLVDVGLYRASHKAGRWYAMAGEAGLLMCSWPKGDSARASGGFDFYLNECMTGFEYQAAGHMVREGLVTEGLAITRAIHDRYHASKRNPWNEVECGDHYSRAMASFGVYLSALGYDYHGPKGALTFAPRIGYENFKAAFTTAEGWGTFTGRCSRSAMRASIELKWGVLKLNTLSIPINPANSEVNAKHVSVTLEERPVAATHSVERREDDPVGMRMLIIHLPGIVVQAGNRIDIRAE